MAKKKITWESHFVQNLYIQGLLNISLLIFFEKLKIFSIINACYWYEN